MDCPSCERIEQYFFDATAVWCSAAIEHSLDKVASLAEQAGAQFERIQPRLLRVDMTRDGLNQWGSLLSREFHGPELNQLRMFTTPIDREPGAQDIVRVLNGVEFLRRLGAEWLADSLQANRYETWFQPVFCHASDDARSVCGHVARLRLKDSSGNILTRRQGFETAAGTELMFTLDLISRKSAVETAGRHGLKGKLFVGFHPASIYDPAYCLKETVKTVEAVGLAKGDVVFEVDPSLSTSDTAHVMRIVGFYRDHGFGVALGRLDLLDNPSALLRSIRPDFAMIGPGLTRGVAADDFKQAQSQNLLDAIEMLDSRPIAVGLQTEADQQWFASQGVGLFVSDMMAPTVPPEALVSR